MKALFTLLKISNKTKQQNKYTHTYTHKPLQPQLCIHLKTLSPIHPPPPSPDYTSKSKLLHPLSPKQSHRARGGGGGGGGRGLKTMATASAACELVRQQHVAVCVQAKEELWGNSHLVDWSTQLGTWLRAPQAIIFLSASASAQTAVKKSVTITDSIGTPPRPRRAGLTLNARAISLLCRNKGDWGFGLGHSSLWKEGTTWIRKATDRRQWKTLMEGYILQWMDKA